MENEDQKKLEEIANKYLQLNPNKKNKEKIKKVIEKVPRMLEMQALYSEAKNKEKDIFDARYAHDEQKKRKYFEEFMEIHKKIRALPNLGKCERIQSVSQVLSMSNLCNLDWIAMEIYEKERDFISAAQHAERALLYEKALALYEEGGEAVRASLLAKKLNLPDKAISLQEEVGRFDVSARVAEELGDNFMEEIYKFVFSKKSK